ncbi:MAG: hypothetical protein ABEJ82_07215 [Haloplanus sp.]
MTTDETGDAVPDWDDEYLDRVSDRLMHHYDLERDRTVEGERFDLYGQLHVENQKQFLHPSINFANHETHEHLFARRQDAVSTADFDHLVELGHALADEWVTPDETHQGTDFTFVLVVPTFDEAVRSHVEGFSERTLLKYGYYGHYELNLAVVAPDRRAVAASENADVARAFALWDDPTPADSPGFLGRLARAFKP